MANLKDFTKFQTPTGQTGNLLNPASWIQGILGVVALLAFLGIGQRIAKRIESASGGRVDTTPGSFVEPAAPAPSRRPRVV